MNILLLVCKIYKFAKSFELGRFLITIKSPYYSLICSDFLFLHDSVLIGSISAAAAAAKSL